MKLQRVERGYRATVPCKVNLFLEVLGKRPDGYHDLDTLMLAVSLPDELTFYPWDEEKWELSVTYEAPVRFHEADPAWEVPSDGRNLVLRAARLLTQRMGIPGKGGKLHLHKRIPSMAGLGGGSADGAAALALVLAAWGEERHWEDALECAGELGSDINFFLEGRNESGGWIARCSGRGERIEPLPAQLEAVALVIVHPPVGCGTAEVFSKSRRNGSDVRTPARMMEALANGSIEGVGTEVFNALEIPASEVTEWISRAGRWIDRYDHFGQALSGSGSSRFCLCKGIEQAERIAAELQSQNEVRVYAARPWSSQDLRKQLRGIREGACDFTQ